jgi:serine/threonine protein kinase/Flp pilus assembly protein TadD
MASDRADAGGLEEILAGYVSRLNAGEEISPEEVLLDHPSCGAEILEQLEVFIGAPAAAGAAAPRLGTLGDFTLRRQIGRGGMGVVYEAWQRSMDRRVALKVLPAGLLADKRAVARFRREAKLAGRLHHPNVVSVYGMGVEEGTPCFAMEFVEGETLEQLLRRSRPSESRSGRGWGSRLARSITRTFSAARPALTAPPAVEPESAAAEAAAAAGAALRSLPREIDLKYCLWMAEAFAGAADGLQHAHAQGIIHRDLKPSNLILGGVGEGEGAAGRLRILDFGLARLEGQETLTASGDFVGTPRYMSPEQASVRRVPIDHRTDIYSLGATLYEMLALRPAFEGRDYQDTLSQIIHRDAEPLRRLNPRIPKDLETIVAKCLRKEPLERYRTAEALAQDLRRCVRGDPIEARPQPGWEKLARRAWRHRTRIGVALFIAGLIVSLGWVLADNSRKARLQRIASYEPLVLRAVMKMQHGRLARAAEPAERPGARPDDAFFDFEFQTLGEDSALDPVDEAVRELEEATAMLPERPDAHFHRARGLLILGRSDEALDALARVLDVDPGFVPASILRAAILERRGEPGRARAEIERASSSAAKGWAEVWVSAHLAMAERRWSDAAKAYGIIIDAESAGHDPYLGSSAETRLGRGVARLETSDFAGAIEDFVAARTLWPDSMEPELLLGKAYLLEGRKEKAEETFQRLLGRARIHDEAATATAAIYNSLKEYAAGLEWAAKVREPSLRERLRSALLFKLGRTADAAEAGRKAVAADPGDAQAYLVLAQAEEARGAPVAELLRKAVAADAKNASARVWLALDLSRSGAQDEAEELLRTAVCLDPGSHYGHYALARLLEQRGALLEALSHYARALEVARGAFGSHLAASAVRLLRRLGKSEVPVDDLARTLEQALASNPENAAALLRSLALAKLYEPRGRDTARAIEYARLAVEKTGRRDPEALGALAEVQFASGDGAEAVRVLEEALRLPDAGRGLLSSLEDYRRALLPRLASYASIDAALEAPELESVVPAGSSWRFFRGRAEPSAGMEWTAPEFDDAAWESGPSGFGYGDPQAATVLGDMAGAYSTVYLRRRFTAADPARFRRLRLSVRADDGFVAYLNGREVGRERAGKAGARVPFDALADFITKEPSSTELWLDASLVRDGENCLAVQCLNGSMASTDLIIAPALDGELPPPPTRDQEIAAGLRALAAAAKDGAALLVYVEARLLQRAGDHRGAAEKLGALAAADGDGVEPILRLAESLGAAGDPAAAEARLREALATDAFPGREVWDRWLELAFVRLGRSPSELLAKFPGTARGGYGDDVRWLLERLDAGEPVRIRAGGDDYRSRAGALWGKDRFYLSGHGERERGRERGPRPEDVAGTEDDALYLSERHFRPDDLHPPAYRVPLPPGAYQVTLHFAELSTRVRSPRRFDVRLEGKTVLEDYDPADLGLAVARRHGFKIEAADAFLDIEFGYRNGFPRVCAIEIEALR